ncbi:MAG TPA: rhodanese-like domain-containing protein [Lacunisphaera sp.]|jgi:rhodanese-related sulfurtransferase|nr:rhodanese-like domain-containing protein [Lacunisphaera sp.]
MSATLTMPDAAKAREYFTNKMDFTTGPVELNRAIQNGEVVVIDVRAAEDYRKGHVPGAISLPHDRWDNPSGLRKDKVNVLYCYSQVCHLAATAAIKFTARGFPVKELEGGFEGWKDQGLPVERPAAPNVIDPSTDVRHGMTIAPASFPKNI